MISSFSCESALAAIRERWSLVHSRAKKNAGNTKVGDHPPRLQLSLSGSHTLQDRCEPNDVWNNSFYQAILRDETFEDVELGAPYQVEDPPMQSQPKSTVRRPAATLTYDNCSSMARSEAHHAPTDTPDLSPSRSLEIDEPSPINTPNSTPSRSFEIDEPSPTAPKPIPFIEDSLTAEPEVLSTSQPLETVHYTPGGRAIPAIPYSMCKAPTRLSLSYPVRPAKSLESHGNQRDNYTRITPASSSQAPKRGRSRYSRPKVSSMANTPISEDEELSLTTSETSSSKSTLAESEEVLSPSLDGSVDTKCDRSTSNTSANVATDGGSDRSQQCPRRAEYVEDSQLLPARRQTLRQQKRHAPSTMKDSGYRQPNQARGFTYPPPPLPLGAREFQVSNAYPDPPQTQGSYRNAHHYSVGAYPAAGHTAGPAAAAAASTTTTPSAATRRIASNYSLHQRALLSQWRANLAAESAKASVDSPWTAQGGDAIAAGDPLAGSSAVPGTVTREAWRERQTKNGCAGWGSRGEARMLSGMDAREIELAHREVLRRMQAGANRRLEMSLAM